LQPEIAISTRLQFDLSFIKSLAMSRVLLMYVQRQLAIRSIILANQRINEEGVGLRPVNQTIRGDWFSAGSLDPLDLRARLLTV
jgi:hypothetical protein